MMQSARTGCKGCMDPWTPEAQEAQLERLWKKMKLKEGEAVSDEVYEARLAVCRACDALQGGTTCRHCGCLVQYRSRLTDAACPYPGQPKWL